MPVILMLGFFLAMTAFLLLSATGFQFGFPAIMLILATLIAGAGLYKAAHMLDKE